MTWGVEGNVIERFAGAGIPKENISFAKDTYTFNFPGTPSEFVAAFRKILRANHECLGGRRKERPSRRAAKRASLCNRESKSRNKNATSIPATFLRVTVAVH
jgi:hypothetical protein